MELQTDRMKLVEVFPDAAKTWAKRLHIKADAIDYVRKGIPIDPQDISIEEGERAAIRYVSTPRLDRDNEILLPDGVVLDTFREAPTVLYAHDYHGLPIGKDIWIKTTKRGILAKTVYANHQLAQDVYDCVKDGFLTSSSVGFIPVEFVKMGDKEFVGLASKLADEYGVPLDEAMMARRIYTKWVLLEHSDVPVPSNAQSLNVLVGKDISAKLKKDLGVPVEAESAPTEDTETVAETDAAPVAGEAVAEPDVVTDSPEAKDASAPDVGSIKVTMELSPEMQSAIDELKSKLDALRSEVREMGDPQAVDAKSEPVDDVDASVPFMLADIQEHVNAIEKRLCEIDGKVESMKAASAPAPAVLDAGTIVPKAETPAQTDPPKPAFSESDVKRIAEMINLGPMIEKHITLAFAKLRGRVVST